MPRRFCKRARPRAAPSLPSVPAAAVRAAAAHPRRCRPSVPHPDAPQHCHPRIPSTHRCRRCRPSAPLPPVRRSTPALTFHPRAAARPPSHSVHAPPLRERAAPPGWHPRHPHAVAVIRPRRASVYRRGMAQDGTVLPRLSIPARRHGRSTLCFCALANYHSAVLTNARPPCYAEASAGRGRPRKPRRPAGETDRDADAPQTPRPPRPAHRAARRKGTARRPAAGNEPGRTLRNPRALPQGTNRGRTLLQPPPPCRGGRAGSRTARVPPPKTNGLRARHRAAGGKEAACSASSCPRCARWRR